MKAQKQLRKWQGELEAAVVEIANNLRANDWVLAKRMTKYTFATTVALVLGMIPAVVNVLGKAIYLAAIATVFGHPGRRLGQMVESLALLISGSVVGTAWVCLGLYFSSLVYDYNEPAAYTIRGIWLSLALLFHGYFRSSLPRLFQADVIFMIVSVVGMTSTATSVTAATATTILYPLLAAVPLLFIANTCIFPELSSGFLGVTTIQALQDTVDSLRDAGKYFVTLADAEDEKAKAEGDPSDESSESQDADKKDLRKSSKATLMPMFAWLSIFVTKKADAGPKAIKLSSLTERKAKLRAKLAGCKAAQQECNFELAFSVLPPQDMKSISTVSMSHLVASTIALIGACESRYALLGEMEDVQPTEKPSIKIPQASTPAEQQSATSPDDSGMEASDAVSPLASPSPNETGKQLKKRKKNKKKEKKTKSKTPKSVDQLKLLKPTKEIEFADVALLTHIIKRVGKPITDLQKRIDRSVEVVSATLAYCYDVARLPSGARPPRGIEIEELKIHENALKESLKQFDIDSASAFEEAARYHELEGYHVDMMLRMETFLICSFLLNLRQAAKQVLDMLEHTNELVVRRHERKGRRRIYLPSINWKKWLASGGEQDKQALPDNARKDARTGTFKDIDDEVASLSSRRTEVSEASHAPLSTAEDPEAQQVSTPRLPKGKTKPPNVQPDQHIFAYKLRNKLADFIEFVVNSDDVLYATKLTVSAMIVAWPAFVAQWNTWYSLNRGLWAVIQLVLVTEVSIGTSLWTLFIRSIGTTIGCLWGWAAYEAGNGNPYILMVVMVIGIIPSTYVQLGTPQVKAGIVLVVSMCVVSLASKVQTVPGTATETFLKRWLSFLIGGFVAVLMEVLVFPIRARDRLVESLASSIRQVMEMEACVAYGVETETNLDPNSPGVSERFDIARLKAQGALTAAETFLSFCSQEPRLKGSFAGLQWVYKEMLFVLHQIVDRMDNMLQIRKEFGSGVMEELNSKVFAYRRNVAGAITLILFAVHEALTTKLPLPQFMPSARLAQLRMINRVREIVLSIEPQPSPEDAGGLNEAETAIDAASLLEPNRAAAVKFAHDNAPRSNLEATVLKRIIRQKFLAWNAASAGQIEVIEYLEELVDLAKLLVGANEFKSGMLMRPTYREYVAKIGNKTALKKRQNATQPGAEGTADASEHVHDEQKDQVPEPVELGLTKRSTQRQRPEAAKKEAPGPTSPGKSEEEELPRSLQRVRTRRMEEMTRSETIKSNRDGKVKDTF